MAELPDSVALDRFWDSLVRDGKAPETPLGRPNADLVQRLAALDGPPPDPAFVARLEEELVATATAVVPSRRPIVGPSPTAGRAVPPVAPPSRRHPHRPDWRLPVAQVSTAAMVLLTLVAVYFAFGPGRGGGDDRPSIGFQGSPVATPGASEAESLLTAATFAALPADPAELDVWRWTLEPGLVTTRPAGDFPGGVRVDYVVAGRYAARVDGPLLVVRAAVAASAGAPEEVPPGTEALLGPGDAAIYPENDREQSWGNPGTEPLVLLVAGVFGRSLPEPPAGLAVETLGYVAPHELADDALPGGPATLTLRRLVLAPGEERPIDPAAGWAFVHVEDGTLAVGRTGGATTAEGTPAGERTVRQGDTTRLGPRAAVVLRNPGELPLTVLVLAVAPAEPGATPAAGSPAALLPT